MMMMMMIYNNNNKKKQHTTTTTVTTTTTGGGLGVVVLRREEGSSNNKMYPLRSCDSKKKCNRWRLLVEVKRIKREKLPPFFFPTLVTSPFLSLTLHTLRTRFVSYFLFHSSSLSFLSLLTKIISPAQ